MTEAPKIIDNDQTTSHFNEGKALLTAGFVGGVYGGLSWLVWGPEVGAGVTIGVGGISAGLMLVMVAHNRSEQFAMAGKKTKALLMAGLSAVELAVGYGIGAGTVGYALGGPEWLGFSGGFGMFLGALTDLQISLPRLSQSFRERNPTVPNLVST